MSCREVGMRVVFTIESGRTILGMRDRVSDPGQLFTSALPQVLEFAGMHGVAIDGPPLSIYYEIGEDFFDMAVAVPVVGEVPPVTTPMFVGSLPTGRVASVDHVGPYEEISATWTAFMDELASRDVHPGEGAPWEEYTVGPDSAADPADFRTRLVTPIG